MAEPGHRVRRKRRKEEGGREGRAWASGHGACYHLLPHWSPLLSPAATFQGHWEKALYSNKQASLLSHDPTAALVGHTHPSQTDTHTLRAPPHPSSRHSRQPASTAPSTRRWGLAFHFDPDAHHQAPEPVKAHKPTHGEWTTWAWRRDSQDRKGSHCLNPQPKFEHQL